MLTSTVVEETHYGSIRDEMLTPFMSYCTTNGRVPVSRSFCTSDLSVGPSGGMGVGVDRRVVGI